MVGMARNLRARKALIKSFCSRWPVWSHLKIGEIQRGTPLVFKNHRVLPLRLKPVQVQMKVRFRWILKTHKKCDIRRKRSSQRKIRVVPWRKPSKIKTRTESTASCSRLMNTTIARSICSSSNQVISTTQPTTGSGTRSPWVVTQAITKLPPPTVYSTRSLASLAFWRMKTPFLRVLRTKLLETRQKLIICAVSLWRSAKTKTPLMVIWTI